MTVLNGRLPLSSLVHIGTDAYGRAAYLAADAAASWARMRAAGMPMDLSDAYRDYARQVVYEKNPPNSAGLAAVAGTSSHGWGLAVDARGRCLDWLARHGAAHGWVRTILRETWHYQYLPARDQHRHDPPEDIMASLDEVSALLDQKIKALRLQLRADMIEQTKKVVTPEAVARVLLDAQVPEHPELTGTEARRVGVVLRDTRIQTARIDKRTRE